VTPGAHDTWAGPGVKHGAAGTVPTLIGTASNLDYQLGYGAGNVAAAGFRSLVSNMLEHLRSSA
jgi:hypothetical protein